MADKADNEMVSLRVDVTRAFRTRLRTEASRAEKNMGEFLEMIADKPLRQIELKALEKAKANDS
jgi:hypothetical protein